MMLFKLSLKNIKKSIKDYAIYFFTLILGVAIFYVFNAIDSQTAMLDISSRMNEILKLLTNLLSGVSVFVSFILAFLIIYASRFLMKRRNKEFGIYLTLGMSKRKISLILFLETLFIGILSLTVGIGIGFLLSQLMSILVANMFEANLTKFTFVFSKSACIKTLIYFGIMYLVVMIFNTINISKCKLIDLIHSSKKSEKVKLKNSSLCMVIFIISLALLGYSYYRAVNYMKSDFSVLILILMGAVSTFLIFWSLSGLILKIVKKNKRLYYKKLNSFTTRQISSKINTTVFQTTIICLMLFITICVLSSSLSMKNALNKNLRTYAPVDVEFSTGISNSDTSIEDTFERFGFDFDENLKDVVKFRIYTDSNVTLKSSLGSYYKEIKNKYSYLKYDDNIILMRKSDYNNVAKSFNLKRISLKDNEYALVGNYKQMISVKEEALKRNTKIKLNSKTYYPKYKKAINGFYEMGSQEIEGGFIVLPDSAFDGNNYYRSMIIANYKDNKNDVDKKLSKVVNSKGFYVDYGIAVNTKKDITESSVGLGAIVTFLGLYLGLISLISCAAMLALKELSEQGDNASKFNTLRKLGVDEKTLNKALYRQIEIFFMFPLSLAIIHSVFGIMFCNNILKTMGVSFNLQSVILTAIFIVFIYGGYFLITYFCSKNIIKENR